MECAICKGRGIILGEHGYQICRCRRDAELHEYIRPLRMCVEDKEKAVAEEKKAKPLGNQTQAILRNDRNIISLIKMVCTDWFPTEYRIVSVSDLNAIEFGKWNEYKSVHDLITTYHHIIVDARFIGSRRDPKMREYDEQILIELLKMSVLGQNTRVVILLPETLKRVADAYPGLTKGWNEVGQFYYSKGKIGKFPVDDAKNSGEE